MPGVGDDAPDFTAPLANGEVGEFTLSDRLHEAPLVLAFFPAAFTGTCTSEMQTFQDRLAEFEAAEATVYGVSVDLPFTLNEFRTDADVSFGMISDSNREAVDAFDVSMDFASMGVEAVARRSVFVVDGDGVVRYCWVGTDPGIEPDYDEVLDAVASLS